MKTPKKTSPPASTPGYPYRWPQPAGAMTFQLNGAQVGRGNTLNIQGTGFQTIAGNDKVTYLLPGGGSSPTGDPNTVAYFDGTGALTYSPNFLFNQSTKLFSVGDIFGSTNRTVFTLDDANKNIRTALDGTWVVEDTAGNPFILVDSTLNRFVGIGDNYGAFNGTKFTVDVPAKQITGKANVVTFGDTDGTGDNTYIYLRDDASAIDIYNEGLISFRSPMSGEDVLIINPVTKVVSIGDIADNVNNTKFILSDFAQTIELRSHTGTFIGGPSAGEIVLQVNPSTMSIQLGDAQGAHNGTRIVINDSTQHITVSNVPVFANDAAATGGGLTSGMLYKTTTGGITALNIVP